ncbi:MAG TPA: hypothetical protein VE690_16310 [Rhodopila sp.]|nr:hypothetical protein [Rhodopila sp.]
MSVIPVKDTVWWNGTGGVVTEHREDNAAACTLTFRGDNGTIAFNWEGTGRTSVTVIDPDWQLSDDQPLPVAMQVGDVWLSNGGNSAVIEGQGHGSVITFHVAQEIEPLLAPADRIEVRVRAGTLSVALNRSKLSTVLDRTRRCLGVIRR